MTTNDQQGFSESTEFATLDSNRTRKGAYTIFFFFKKCMQQGISYYCGSSPSHQPSLVRPSSLSTPDDPGLFAFVEGLLSSLSGGMLASEPRRDMCEVGGGRRVPEE